MKKSTIIKIMTIPWGMLIIRLLWAAEHEANKFTEPWQVFAGMVAVAVCMIIIIAGFCVAEEVKAQDQEVISLRKKLLRTKK